MRVQLIGGSSRHRQAGFSLPAALFALVVLGILVRMSASVTMNDRRASVGVTEGTRAFGAAEAGMNEVIALWDSMQYDTLVSIPGASVDLGWQALPETGASYRASLQRVDGGGAPLYSVTVEGRTAGPLGGRQTLRVMGSGAASLFQWAAFGRDKMKFSSSSGTDSYDSRNGPYDPGTAGSEGNVGSNGDITTSGSAFLDGDATAGGTVSDPSAVSGTVTNGAPAVPLPDVDCPTGGFTASVPAGPGVSYNPATGVLTVSGGNNLTLNSPPTEYYFSEVSLSGGSTLTINFGAGHVDIYVSTKLTTSGGGVLNTAGLPTMLSIWGCGTDNSAWALSGGSGAYYTIYAPHHKVTLSGGSDFWGALVGGEIDNSGGSKIHYDEALGKGSGALPIIEGSWTEVSP